ncbi:MAG: tyrosine-type recombinase/integrase [Desulfuromonadales bacterium]|nr:tyrosine-type recombinase/integrase [Desulfuromonadales bacterium]
MTWPLTIECPGAFYHVTARGNEQKDIFCSRNARALRCHPAVLVFPALNFGRRKGQSPGMVKRAGCHTVRHCFATHWLESGCSIRTTQELWGHKDVNTTMMCTPVLTSLY